MTGPDLSAMVRLLGERPAGTTTPLAAAARLEAGDGLAVRESGGVLFWECHRTGPDGGCGPVPLPAADVGGPYGAGGDGRAGGYGGGLNRCDGCGSPVVPPGDVIRLRARVADDRRRIRAGLEPYEGNLFGGDWRKEPGWQGDPRAAG